MRLSVQSFQRKFDPNDPDVEAKISEFSASLIQQIDTMSYIASAFATYAKLPEQNNASIDLVATIRLSLELFDAPYIEFESNCETLDMNFDKKSTQSSGDEFDQKQHPIVEPSQDRTTENHRLPSG